MSVKSVNDIISRCKDYCENNGWTQWKDYVDHIPNRGRGLITNDTQAACYIAAYGYSHRVKLSKMFKEWKSSVLNDDYEIFDWGCGQGLATMTFIEEVPSHILSKLRKVTLIDLSQTVLDIASEYVSDIYDYQVDEWRPNSGITIKKMRCSLPTINGGGLEELTTQYSIAVHLFSNILDIRTIDLCKLAKTVTSAEGKPFHQKHYILATHPGSYDPDGKRMNDFIKNKYFDEGRVEIDEGCDYCHIFGYAESYNKYTTAYCDYIEDSEKDLREELDIRRTVGYCDYMSRLAEQYELDDDYPYNDEKPVTEKLEKYNICPYTTHNFERVGYNAQKPLKVRHDHILSIERKYAYKGANAPYEVVVAISDGQKVFLSYMEAWARNGHNPESIEKYADLIWHKVKYPKPDKKSDDYIAFLDCPESLLKNKVEDYLEKYPESDPLNDEVYFCEMEESPNCVKQEGGNVERKDYSYINIEPLSRKQKVKGKIIEIRNIVCLILGWVLMLFVLGMMIVFILSLFGVEI